MVQLFRPSRIVTERITTKTVQGEITVNLNLTITINQEGTVQVTASPTVELPKEDKFVIPEFSQEEILSDFGQGIGS